MAKTRTFACMCGHLAYWVKYRGWHCMCNNPRPTNTVIRDPEIKAATDSEKPHFVELQPDPYKLMLALSQVRTAPMSSE